MRRMKIRDIPMVLPTNSQISTDHQTITTHEATIFNKTKTSENSTKKSYKRIPKTILILFKELKAHLKM
jgi:hypothetical protein